MATNIPLTGKFKVTCEYKRRGKRWQAGHHTGIDLVNITPDDTIYATCKGIVKRVGRDRYYGNYIVIADSEAMIYHWYCHLSRVYVAVGQEVNRVSQIGKMGYTGVVTGKHLHYEIRTSSNMYDHVISPAKYMGIPNEVGVYDTADYNITSKNRFYNIGDTIKFVAKFTGAVEGDKSMIEYNGKQFWILSELLTGNVVSGIVCFNKKFTVGVDLATTQIEVKREDII